MNNNLSALGLRAESLGIYAVESKDPRIVYFYNDGEYAICTKGFVWRFSEEEAEEIAEGFRGAMKSTVLKELRAIIEDVKYLRETGGEIMRACIKCSERYPACQDSCEKFLEYKAQRDEKLEQIRKAKASDKLARDVAISLYNERRRKAHR